MGEIIHLSQERIAVTLYTGGLPWHGAGRAERERARQLVLGVVRELGPWYFDVRMRSWPAHCYETIWRGGWRTPILLVGRTLYTQGSVPERAALRAYLSEQIHILRPRLAKSS